MNCDGLPRLCNHTVWTLVDSILSNLKTGKLDFSKPGRRRLL